MLLRCPGSNENRCRPARCVSKAQQRRRRSVEYNLKTAALVVCPALDRAEFNVCSPDRCACCQLGWL
eukprot:359900-Chlamydomonas_euryale.AAC.4